MDIVLGVSMTAATIRLVLAEGESADGATVDHDTFDVAGAEGSASTAEQVLAAILGTRESAAEGGHHLISTGVAWNDHAIAGDLRKALVGGKIHDVVLVSELQAAAALAQAVGRTVGYSRTALMFLECDTATVAVVQTGDGAVVKVHSRDLHTEDAVAELQDMVVGLEALDPPPQGLFMIGSGIDIAAITSSISAGTALPVHAPDEPQLALARGAALASAHTPRYEATTVGLAYAQDPDGTTAGAACAADDDTELDAGATQLAAAGYMAPLGYSAVSDDDIGFDGPAAEAEEPIALPEPNSKPFLLVGSALTAIFVVGVVALVLSLAVSIRPTVDQRPSPGESAILPGTPAPPPPEAQPPAPAPSSAPETIQEPVPVVQQAPRTVFVNPAPQAPAPAPAAPAPAPAAPAPAPAPVAPALPAAPVLPVPVVPPVVVLPPPILPPFLRPRVPQQQYPSYPSAPPTTVTVTPTTVLPTITVTPTRPAPPVVEAPPPSQAPGSGGYGSDDQGSDDQAPGSGGYGSGGSDSGHGHGQGNSGSGGGADNGSGGGYGSGGGSGSGGDDSGSEGPVRSGGGSGSQNPLWPLWPGSGH